MLNRRSKTVQIVIILSGCLLGLSLFIFRKKQQERPHLQLEALQTQINALAKGAVLYSQDHNDHLPSAERWKDQLALYVGREYLRNTNHIALNRATSDRSIVEMKDVTGAILFFEANNSPSADVEAIPLHSDTGAFAVSFVDGHGYPRSFHERAKLIRYSKEATTLSR